MKFRFLTLGVVLATTSAFQVRAKPLDPALLVGSWKLTAMYDEFADGRKRETWGADPQGILQFTSNGIASVQLTGSARTP